MDGPGEPDELSDAYWEKFSKSNEEVTMQHQAMARKLRARQITFTALPIMAMMFGMGKELMAQTKASTLVRNIVLVHGGFVDGSGWEGVYNALTKDGYTVAIVQNPTISLADDVAVTKRAIAAQNGSVILVGHSYGGAVITQAGNDPKVVGLVYITAFALDKGESVSSLIKDPPPGAPVPPILPPVDGYLLLDRTKFPASFAGDVSPEKAAFMADSQVPWGLDALNGTVSEPAWKAKPSWYLVTTEDKMIPPDAQRAMSKRAGSTVVEVQGSHSIYVSQPQAVAHIIEEASRGALLAGKEGSATDALAAVK
jgi:pimeloyl-ACP methyl ester carboxylesterase